MTGANDCGHYRCYGSRGYQLPAKPQTPAVGELLAKITAQAAEIERLTTDLAAERAAHDKTRLDRSRARLDGIREARANMGAGND